MAPVSCRHFSVRCTTAVLSMRMSAEMELLVVNPVKESLDDVVMFCIKPTYAEAEIRRGERRK